MDAYLEKKKFAYLWPPRLKILRSSLIVALHPRYCFSFKKDIVLVSKKYSYFG